MSVKAINRRTRHSVLVLGLMSIAAIGCGTTEPASPTDESPAGGTSTAEASPASLSPTQGSPTIKRSDLDPAERAAANMFRETYGWKTDFSQKNINLTEIDVLLLRDQIIPIDEPTFAPISEPPPYMEAREPVISLEINGDARAYPLAMLMWHEIVNDTVGGLPVTVTFCPLCNSALVFERTVDGEELTFGTTGALRNSDLVMWDRQTESWWQQITGEAIVGRYAGLETRLEVLPSSVVAWEAFVDTYPKGSVLERKFDERGFPIRRYDVAPYAGYDSVDNANPFAFTGPVDGRLPAAAKVLTLEHDGTPVAYPFSFLEGNPVVNDSVGSLDFVALFDSETLSAFVDELENPQVSGSVTVFDRTIDGMTLEFELVDGAVKDTNTGSTWSVTGVATDGPLAGKQLAPVVHGEHFWFAWAVFKPGTELRGVE